MSDTEGKAGPAGEESAAAPEAKSLKCMTCGVMLRNDAAVEWHAVKSQHTDFAESEEEVRPLTDEEKAAKLQALRERLAVKRQEEARADARRQRENEAIRRKADADSARAIEEQRRQEQLRQVEKQKRQRREDQLARQRVKEQIEADKAARRAQAESDRRRRLQTEVPAPAAAAPTVPAQTATASAATETRIQLRVTGKPPVTARFPVEHTLWQVAEAVQPQTGVTPATARFTSTYPRKTYAGPELQQTLRDLGLVPSAALILE